jgi:hypothetical protein
MAVPAIGAGIVLLTAASGNTFISGAVGSVPSKTTLAIDANDLLVTGRPGLNPDLDTCQVIENTASSTSPGNVYTAYSQAFTATDISSVQSCVIVHLAGNPGSFNRVDNLWLYLLNSPRTDWARFDIGNSSDEFFAGVPTFFAIGLFDDNIIGNSGSWDIQGS